MKIILLIFFLLLISSTAFCQNRSWDWINMDSTDIAFLFNENGTDSIFDDNNFSFILGSLPDKMECRLNDLSDSLIRLYAKYDVLINLKDSVQKYYVIGNASGRPVNITPKYALEKYNLILIYTHCRPCKYELEYRNIFEKLYFKKYGENIEKLISKIEDEAIEEHNRIYSENKN